MNQGGVKAPFFLTNARLLYSGVINIANVSHSSLTGSQLHEPKGVAAAASGEVYVANGSGSGTWTSISVSSFTGAVADFITPTVPSGWLELDGSIISTSTFSALASVMKIAFTGTRTNGSPIITSIASTSNMKAGYYVFGTGFASPGITILTVDSPTQITVSSSASSSGTGALDTSPWAMNTGTITLPDLTTAGRFRRSRTSSTKVGDVQADQNKAHTHTLSGTTGNQSADHTHTFSGTSGNNNQSLDHTHNAIQATQTRNDGTSVASLFAFAASSATGVNNSSLVHTHNFSGTTAVQSTNHNHTFSATTDSNGGADTRPVSIVVLTCVKT